MVFELMRTDPAFRTGLGLAVAAAIIAPLLPLGLMSITLIPAGAVYFAFSGMVRLNQRATLFQLALPISARDLFLARVLSLIAMVWLPVAAGSFTVSLIRTHGSSLSALAGAAAIFTLGIAILQSSRIDQVAASGGLLWIVAVAGSIGSVLALLLLPRPILFGGSFVLSAILLGSAWMRLPATFQATPLETWASRRTARPALLRMPAWWPMLRSGLNWNALIFTIVLLTQALSGQWLYAVCFGMGLHTQVRSGMQWLFGLPLSHRTRFLLAVIPTIAPFLFGAVLNANRTLVHIAEPALVTIGGGDFAGTDREPYEPGTPNVQVPLEFWKYAPESRTPEIRAPWGESVHPRAIRTLGVPMYNPYEVERASSKEFMEWQFERATAAIYGRAIPRRDYEAARRAGMRSVLTSPRYQVLNLASLFVAMLFAIVMAELERNRRLSHMNSRTRSTLIGAVFVVPLVAVIGYDFTQTHGVSGTFTNQVQSLALLWCLRALPENFLVTAVIAGVVVAAAYWGVERLAAESEATAPAPPQSSSH